MSQLVEVKIPDIGDFKEVEVIEILVAEGDTITEEQSLITVESDKASMEIPSSHAGVVKSLKVKIGDKIAEGAVVLELEPASGKADMPAQAEHAAPAEDADAADAASPAGEASAAAQDAPETANTPASPGRSSERDAGNEREPAAQAHILSGGEPPRADVPAGNVLRTPPVPAATDSAVPVPHASPSVRKFARELGVDLYRVRGSGPKQRVTHDDVRGFVKNAVAQSSTVAPVADAGGTAMDLLPWPQVDFSKFGPVQSKPLSRIQKLSGANLHRNWVMIPHVTNNDEADITELEALRVQLNRENEKAGIKVTMLAFLIKAVVAALKKYPQFNASLDGDNLVFKQYFHIGFAADTPNGLVVPVIRDADSKGILELAQETSALAKKARDGKLSPADMQGGCFSISSLGGIGGTHFTPIINAPEVAILGVSRSYQKPVWDGQAFAPRLTLPLSLSYDHRVIDGAAAARFNAHLGMLLADFRRIAL